jgi:hypothetical protein
VVVVNRIVRYETDEDILAASLRIVVEYLTGVLSLHDAADALAKDPAYGVFSSSLPMSPDQRLRLDMLFARRNEYERRRLLRDARLTAQPIEQWAPPDDPTHFCWSVAVMATARDDFEQYEASFRAFVCTPSWLAEQSTAGWWWPDHALVVSRWDPPAIRQALQVLAHREGSNRWPEFIDRIGQSLMLEWW